ncbi:MAG TPA: hypothetical protein PKO25_08895 [Spirochaetota bacterium]|nr:hypothetical protein [Spirochaetota bacterium]HPV98526.1 hypothetical protein [Spirochaetota bacterium]
MKKIMLITIIALLPFLNHAQGSEAKKSIKPTCISGDCKNGKGVLIYASGNRYEGDFKDGKFDGKGVIIFTNGARYEGDWKNDKRHGKGVLIYANGDRYEGDFKDGKIHGIGTLYNSKNKNLKKGRWEKGEYVGP